MSVKRPSKVRVCPTLPAPWPAALSRRIGLTVSWSGDRIGFYFPESAFSRSLNIIII